jgi:hypothetical protein
MMQLLLAIMMQLLLAIMMQLLLERLLERNLPLFFNLSILKLLSLFFYPTREACLYLSISHHVRILL